jgi:chemotaxis protein CheZ
MRVQRKIFRIEAMNSLDGRQPIALPGGAHDPAQSHAELMNELRALRRIVEPQQELVTQRVIDAYKAELSEAQKLKAELDLIYEAINMTKREIATLHVTGFEGPEMKRVTHELDAIVGGTEQATEQILSSAESIDQDASTLSARLKDEQNLALVQDMQEKVIKIFEACNFQDLTGQRITKVVNTLKFIESHIMRMMEIWGGIESFQDVTPEVIAEREGDAKLLNGPKLDGEDGHASQDDIDALFA